MMRSWILVGLAAAGACYTEKRTRSMTPPPAAEASAEVQARERAAAREREQHEAAHQSIEQKIDALNAKLDEVIARQAAAPAPPPARPRRIEPDRALTYAVPIDGNPFDGPANAKVTLVKAFDYACGYCEKNRATIEDLKKKYGKDLRIVYKHLVIHPRNATVGALAFCAASKQGKHREMDQLIWDKGFHARDLDLTDVPVDPPGGSQGNDPPQMVKCWDHPAGCKNVYGYAAELRLNLARFKADLKGDCAAVVANDGRQLAQLSISATPSFFINGRYLSGAQPVETFSALIDEELKKAKERIAAGTPAASYYQKWVIEKGEKSVTPPPASP